MRSYFLLSLFILPNLFSGLNAQTISGKVVDSASLSPLKGASIRFTSTSDATLIFQAISDSAGFFSQKISKGAFRLDIELAGFISLSRSIQVDDIDIQLGNIFLTDIAKSTGTALITTTAPPVKQIGDTTEFNAGSYKVNPDATAEDLVKKLPGTTVENGTVKVQGEEVKKVTVDGKDFFGDDAQTALKNLPADIVDKIQVFERMSDQAQFTGFDDGQGVKGINIKTKRGKANGTFGKVYAGYGTDSRYQGGLNFNNFNGNRRITVLGMSNNINIQNFSSQDLLGISSGNSGGMGRGPGGMGGGQNNTFLVNQAGGISITNAIGLNYNDKWGKKITVGLSYFMNKSENNQEQKILRTYNNSSVPFWYSENSISENTSLNHRMNMRLEYAPDTNNSFIYTPTLSFQNTKFDQKNLATNYTGSDTLNNSDISYLNEGRGYNFSHSLMYRHKFAKASRTISLSVDNQLNAKNTEATNLSSNHSFVPSDSIFVTNQNVLSNTPQRSYGARFSYTEPINKIAIAQLDYRYSLNLNENDKETKNYNNAEQAYTLFDTALSNLYNTRYYSHQPGIMLRIRGQKLNIGMGAGVQFARLRGNQYFPVEDEVDKKFFNVLPRVFMNYKWNKTTNLRGMFRTSTNIPSVSQLQNVINNSNPLILNIGNPELRQEVSQNLNLNLSKSNPVKLTNIFVGIMGTQTSNYITNSTRFLNSDTQISDGFVAVRGAQITSPVNLNGYWTARVFGVYGFPVKKIKSNMNLNSTYSIGQKPGLINGVENLATTQSISGGVSVNSNISENIDYNIGYTSNYYVARNSSQTSLNNTYINNVANVKMNYILKSKLVLSTEANYNLFSGLSTGFDQKFLLWNAAVAYKFLKGNAGELRLTCFDLLKQNRSISRTVYETYIEDNSTKVLTRYFMLTFTYNFRKFANGGAEPKASTTDPNHPGRPPGGFPGGKPPFGE